MTHLVLPDSYRRRAPEPTGETVRLASGQLLPVTETLKTEFSVGFKYQAPGGLVVIATVDDTETWRHLLHVSVSLPDRLPPWPLMKAIREAFYPPDVDVMMVMPREKDYVNLHPHCFHLWQTPEAWGMR